MKRVLALILSLTLLLCSGINVSAKDFELENFLAGKLSSLGLFLGTENGFELERKLTRTEALVMMLRTMGKETEAEGYGKTHPFSDVAPWADGYVSYAYDKGLTKGISDTIFGANNEVESNMYLTFILRALGYTDSDNKDFIWQMPYGLASELEILPPQTDLKNFSRADVAIITAAALFAKFKDSDDFLYTKLISDGAFSNEGFFSAFPEDPFSEYKKLNSVLKNEFTNGKTDLNKYKYTHFVILDVSENENIIDASVLRQEVRFSVSSENIIQSDGTTCGILSFKLDKNTYKVISSDYPGFDYYDIFPESAIGPTNNLVWQGMDIVIGNRVSKIIETGAFLYTPPTYEDAIKQLTPNSAYVIKKTIETEPCTIALGCISGTPHGSPSWLRLVYKPNSSYGEGKTVSLPMPDINAWGLRVDPEKLYLSEDGLTLYYSYHFENDMILKISENEKRVIHEKGTYNYTVNLITAEVNLEIVK